VFRVHRLWSVSESETVFTHSSTWCCLLFSGGTLFIRLLTTCHISDVSRVLGVCWHWHACITWGVLTCHSKWVQLQPLLHVTVKVCMSGINSHWLTVYLHTYSLPAVDIIINTTETLEIIDLIIAMSVSLKIWCGLRVWFHTS